MWKWLPQIKLQIHPVDMSLNFDPNTLSNSLKDLTYIKTGGSCPGRKKNAKSLPVIIPRKIVSMVQYILTTEWSIRV